MELRTALEPLEFPLLVTSAPSGRGGVQRRAAARRHAALRPGAGHRLGAHLPQALLRDGPGAAPPARAARVRASRSGRRCARCPAAGRSAAAFSRSGPSRWLPRTRKASDPLADLPPWAQKLAQAYYTKTVSTFLLHGAVRDLQPLGPRGRPLLRPAEAVPHRGAVRRPRATSCTTTARAASAPPRPDSQKDFTRTLSGLRHALRDRLRQGAPPRPRPGAADPRELPADAPVRRAVAGADHRLRRDARPGRGDGQPLGRGPVRAGHPGEVGAATRQFLAGDLSIVLLVENLAEISARLVAQPLRREHRAAACPPRRSGRTSSRRSSTGSGWPRSPRSPRRRWPR